MRQHLTSVRILSPNIPQITNLGKDAERRKPFTLLVAVKIGTITMDNIMETTQITKNRTTIWSSNSTLGYIDIEREREKRNTNQKKDTYSPGSKAALFTIVKIRKQPKCSLADEWKICVIYTVEYYSAIERNFVICNNMGDLEGIMLSE